MMYQYNGIKINVNSINKKNEYQVITNYLQKKFKVKNITKVIIIKKSIDARKKPDIYYIYSVAFLSDTRIDENKFREISYYNPVKYHYEQSKQTSIRPVIVGSGPAGLFCAYSLVKSGLKPIIIERGKEISERQKDVNEFWATGNLNTESNVQFGEGGAGTFSDGKLNTGIKDKSGKITEVLRIFNEFGADEEIKYNNKPHIGTDVLKDVIINIRQYLINNGVTYYFSSKLDDLIIENNKLKKIIINKDSDNEKILDCETLILATGHSARDTFLMLKNNNIPMSNKPFAVGLRVMHNQKLIDQNQYGDISLLPAADYKVTSTVKSGRGVYSFCMCPGGYVVNASSESKRLCVNGMSYSGRDSETANSAIVVTIDENDYGTNLLDGMYFQRRLEENAYSLSDGLLTLQQFKDFKNNVPSNNTGATVVNVKGNYTLGNIRPILPDNINQDIIEAFHDFDRKIKGFESDDALLCGVEARTSSPVRILRDDSCESSIKGIYPCGEGAGYAGGITSAAADGLKVANCIVNKYNNQD